MDEAFELLDRQPEGWPRWQPGELPNGAATHDHHLFMLDPQIVDGLLRGSTVRAACHFVDGATRIDYERTFAKLDEGMRRQHCYDCLEVNLQHGLRSMDD